MSEPWQVPLGVWKAAPKDVTWWIGAMVPYDEEPDDGPECPGHGPGTEDEPDFCDGSCVEEEAHARLMAGLLGVDLNDRYPRGDENGIIGAPPKEEPLPRCLCPHWQDYHNDDCQHYRELLTRRKRT